MTRNGYRIDKSHTHRLLAEPATIYHCYAPNGAFIGAAGLSEDAMALCDANQARGLPQ
ncbi:hypothetical protein [Denitromonas sp.]|uniref:hypothetical protein n=1 Tax=Denitromonas sp. TaxID=2734609 RepID=UPI003A865F78